MFKDRHSITLLFNANKVYDRQIIEGVGHYLQSTQVNWDLYLEEDFLTRLPSISQWRGNGIIADFDDPKIEAALTHIDVPVIGVGGSYQNSDDYPNVCYVATDNQALVNQAYEHLKSKGIENFAFYGLPEDPNFRWAKERENAFIQLCKRDGYAYSLYQGHLTRADTWQYTMNRLTDWLSSLANPVGIISVSDSRARHLFQACEQLEKLVPHQVAIVGIDDDEVTRHLCRTGLSSVKQGSFNMGIEAAKLLHRRLENPHLPPKRIMMPPIGIEERESSNFQSLKDPNVMLAMHFIKQNVFRGIKVEQVVDFVGISRSNLENRFKSSVGHSIHHELHTLKLEKAVNLLKNSTMGANVIAETAGYPSVQYMYAVFKKHFGKTPVEFRAQSEETEA
ncbi:XylR family transcriptional regulator [Agaribacter flavus]|uniref:XylR family transcriptional regulator n=1 Tax=Agaribacter flavus TaxID=1902781 RepID=A0ABV7FRZ3_9ALTE